MKSEEKEKISSTKLLKMTAKAQTAAATNQTR